MNLLRVKQFVQLIFKLNSLQNIADIEERIGDLHGLPQKIGQHASLYSFAEENTFQKVYASGTIESIPIESYLHSIGVYPDSVVPIAQASIGQVFKVTTENDVLVAKVKYPKIEKRIQTDFAILSFFAWFTKLLPLSRNPVLSMLQSIQESMLYECDYQAEMEMQERFQSAFQECSNIRIPTVYPKYSNTQMLVSDWVDGVFLHAYLNQSNQEAQKEIFALLFDFEMRSLLKYGIVHTDPHPGNFLIQDSTQGTILHVLDFGSSVTLTESEVAVVQRLLLGQYDDEVALQKDLRRLGIQDDVLQAYQPILGDLVSILLEPFFTPEDYDFHQWRMHYKINTLMSSTEWNKPFVLSMKLLQIVRMFHGLYYYARKYNIHYQWHDGIRDILKQQGGKLTDE